MLATLLATVALAAAAPSGPPPATPPVVAEGAEKEEALRPHGFGIGAQTELISPDVGISSVLLAFDAGRLQYEASLGFGIFERGANALQSTNVYGIATRLYFVVHRTARADFSVGAGVGFSLLDESGAGLHQAWTVLAGAKVRIFVVPNVAIVGALGAGALFREQGSGLLIGARPLGSAGFVYYFE